MPDIDGNLKLHLKPRATLTVELPGLTAVRINDASRVIALDYVSGGTSAGAEPGLPKYVIRDLRGGIYGDFHRLRPAGECFDACGQHGTLPAVVLDDSERHLIGEARRQVTDWHRMHPGQHGVTRALADHAGYLLDLLDKIAPKETAHGMG